MELKTIEEKIEDYIKENSMKRMYMSDYVKAGYDIAKKELEEQLKETISEFKNCYKALEFFEKHADCRTNNVYHCNCNFCKDREHNVLKRNARAYLEKWK